ncbi:hypothetical protein [Qipengyuania marisflavi]|uniref:Uncharacterized protein n=1 Tax=Qipengyuania marisflavi TaxID=2486356 RepID=A0A5S3P3D4_9SPHN|nr:hypothetical protein [Qipengyuania marisflavi]TMM47348.1 hypothetical protein FEV51_09815 [Qipengyuania marisflavi]
MATPSRCLKCDGRMVEGHTIDMGYGSVTPARWQEGAPQKTWFGSIKTKKANLRDIASFRCERCGFLENYVK